MVRMILLDLVYFFSSIAIYLLLFFILHVVVIRLTSGKRLATKLNIMIVVSGVFAFFVTFFAFRNAYSSLSTYVVGTAGAMIASIFILGFYGFSGPVCADRSPSAHMALVLLEESEKGLTKKALKQRYGYDRVFERRIADFVDARIVSQSANHLRLTKKGYRLSRFYMFLIKLLKLSKNY